MKYLYIPLFFLLLSCGAESNPNTSSSGDDGSTPAPEDVIAEMVLDAEGSEITWDRFLDQKATKKKVKFLGAMVDVELGPMQLNMKGEVTPVRGNMTTTNGECSSGNLIFDMKTFKFSEEKGDGIFNTKDYPESELKFNSFKALEGDSVNNYTVSMTLTIQDHSEDIEAPLSIKAGDDWATVKGSFVFNTLDFPLRDNVQKKAVITDEVTVHLDLDYGE